MQLMTNSPTQRVYRPPTALWPHVGDIFSYSRPLETIAESSEEDNDDDDEDEDKMVAVTKEKEEFLPHLLSGEGCKEEEKVKSQ
jgi:hypothetical protein